MAEEEKKAEGEEARPDAVAKTGGVMGMLMSGIGMFVVTLAAVIAGGFINGMLHHPPPPPEYVLGDDKRLTVYVPPEEKKKPEKKKKEAKEVHPAVFYSFDPPLVVNFEESSAVRFLQIGMDIMARDPETITAVNGQMPLIRNNLLMLISDRDYQKLMTREGKEALRKEALAEVRKILKKEAPAAEVEDLLFTSFVVQ